MRRTAALIGLAAVSALAVVPEASAGAAFTYKWREHTIQIDHKPDDGGASWGWVWNGGNDDLNIQASGPGGVLGDKEILRPKNAWKKTFGSRMDTLRVCENQGNRRCRNAVHPNTAYGQRYIWRLPLYSSSKLVVEIDNDAGSFYVLNASDKAMNVVIDKQQGTLQNFSLASGKSRSGSLVADAAFFKACEDRGPCRESLVPTAR
ncbi:hypothetical protein GCM10009534_03410 [Kribbella sandramycini]